MDSRDRARFRRFARRGDGPFGATTRYSLPARRLDGTASGAYVRFKLALTEDLPIVKPYDEARWAVLRDTTLPIEPSLDLLDALHQRWVGLLESMSDSDFLRAFVHPELGILRLDQWLAQYAWHGRHHVAHVTELRKRMGWT
jgi:hypothetical protein